MKSVRYKVVANSDSHMYRFYSEGPNGKIMKGVVYSKIGEDLYNLGFGDWNEINNELNDISRSNNGDRDKILVTVATTALDFTEKYPEANIFIEGSTAARTRLYQMSIRAYIEEINKNFEIKGFVSDSWESFQPDRNYQAFLIKRK